MAVNTKSIDRIFAAAEKDGRDFLLEPEVYAVLRAAGIGVPRHVFVPRGRKVTGDDIAKLGSAGPAVLKIVSPLIQHKSDVGGVAFVTGRPAAVNAAAAEMERTVVARTPGSSRETARSLRGVLLMEKVAFDNVGFGSEILLGARATREFGPVLTVGAGGLDVEYMNERLRDGRAAALASVELMRDDFLPAGLEALAFYGKIAAEFRGRKALVSPAAFARLILAFRELVRAYSPFAAASPFVVEELEVNPLVVRAGKLVPLDGVCRFSRRKVALVSRPAEGIGRLLRPGTIGIIGVSEKMNVGRIILRNVLKHGFPPDKVFVVKPGLPEIDGCRLRAHRGRPAGHSRSFRPDPRGRAVPRRHAGARRARKSAVRYRHRGRDGGEIRDVVHRGGDSGDPRRGPGRGAHDPGRQRRKLPRNLFAARPVRHNLHPRS